MIIACFTNRYSNTIASGLWQYDYGQSLRIQGLMLPTAVEVHFSLHETGGESVTRVGVTKDGITDVIIPDSMLEGNDSVRDYKIYAFIYLTDESSGETTHKIVMPVKARPKPEAFDAPEDAELFREAIAAVNEAVENAKESVTPVIGENGNWFVGGEDTGMYAGGTDGKDGATGAKGATFIPHITDTGELSWTNDGGLKNPNPVNVMGPKGEQGLPGEKGDVGEKGDTGATGSKGDKGDAGNDGVSVTHEWDGTVLKVTSASGTTSADLKGAKGDKGDPGAQGAQGTKGDTGDVGPQGAKGEKGDKGDTGEQGPQGIQGETGLKGDKGDTGAQGPKGDKGDKGDPGTDGRDGARSWNDLEDKPFYEEAGRVEVLPETTFTAEDNVEEAQLNLTTDLVIGNSYTVILNGETYECVAWEFDLGEVILPAIGNYGLISGEDEDSTGEPFVVASIPEGSLRDEFGANAMLACGVEGGITISIFVDGTVIHHLDPKYIEGMYYTEDTYVEILPETTLNADGSIKVIIFEDLKVDNTYTVVVDGIEYRCVAYNFTFDNIECKALGNHKLLTLDGIDTGEPFKILALPESAAVNENGIGIAVFAEEAIKTLRIYEGDITVHQIDPKYLELEWNPTHGEEYCVAEERLVSKNSNTIEDVKYRTLTPDQCLIVYYDSDRYEFELIDSGWCFTGSNNNAPFSILINEGGVCIQDMDTSASHKVALYLYKYEQLPARYTHYYTDALPEKGEVLDEVLCKAANTGVIARLKSGGCVLVYNYDEAALTRIGYVDEDGYHLRRYLGAYNEPAYHDYTAALFKTDGVSVGQHLEVESVSGGLVIFKAVDANVLTSPNGTQYRIVVDDTGTLKAEKIAE